MVRAGRCELCPRSCSFTLSTDTFCKASGRRGREETPELLPGRVLLPLAPSAGRGAVRDPDGVGWFNRVSPGNSCARGLPFMVPCAGPQEGPAAGGRSCEVTGVKPAGVGELLEGRRIAALRAARGRQVECASAARAPGRGGGARRGGSAGSEPGGAAPAAHPAARALPAGGRRALRPPEPRAPALAPSLLVTSWDPAQINFLGIFKTAAARPLCAAAGPRARAPAPRRASNPAADLPARARPGCAGDVLEEGASGAVVCPVGAAWWLGWGRGRIFTSDIFLTPVRGRGAGSKENPWVPAPALSAFGLPGTVPVGALKVLHPRSLSVPGRSGQLVTLVLPL